MSTSLRELLDRHGDDIRQAFRGGDARTLMALEHTLGAWKPSAADLHTLQAFGADVRASIIVSCALAEGQMDEDDIAALTRSLQERER